MKLWCFNDKQSKWGRMLFLAARQRGIDAELFGHPRQVTGPGYMFYRMEQGNDGTQRRHALTVLDKPGIIGVQSRSDIREYEDKVRQIDTYRRWMPETRLVFQQKDSALAADALGFPFISKSRSGSASGSVRVIPDMKSALVEADAVFGDGLVTSREVQKDYLLWQKFFRNEHVYRVVRIGNWYWMLRVFNRPNSPLASGSGRFEPVIPDTYVKREVLSTAVKFFDAARTKWCGIDLLYDGSEWKVLETTLAWDLHSRGANVDCPVFDRNGVLPTAGWTGAHQFEILLREIERGVFDGT